MAAYDDPRARFMVERVHEMGTRTRDELLADLSAEFGPVDELDARLLKAFRMLHAGQIRYYPAGQYWGSLRPRGDRGTQFD